MKENGFLGSVPTGFELPACKFKVKEIKDRVPDWRIEWSNKKASEDMHSGPAWDEWRKNNGKSETDMELW